MTTQKSPYDDSANTYNDNDDDLDMDLALEQGTATHSPVSARTRSTIAREEEGRAPPGPSSSKIKYGARSRSSSVVSTTSMSSNASATVTDRRKSRREQAFEANRQAAAATRDHTRSCSVILMRSDLEEAVDAEEDRGSSTREDRSLKRKMVVEPGVPEIVDGTKKRGRPPDSGNYCGLAAAKEEYNRAKREELDMENERAIRSLSSGQVFSKMERDLETAVDDLCDAPTADVAHRGRESMAEVMKVATISRNLKGGLVKSLKQAAIVGSAATEVLRTRADEANSESDCGDAMRQLKKLKKELELVKREAQQAKEEAASAKKEAEYLRVKLERIRSRREKRGKKGQRRRTYVEDPSSSPSPSPPGLPRILRGTQDTEIMEPEDIPVAQAVPSPINETPMEVEGIGQGGRQSPEFCDERRKRELLPTGEMMPEVLRPPIRGEVKILENRVLVGRRVVPEKRKKDTTTSTAIHPTTRVEEKGSAQAIMGQLIPMLESWLRAHLAPLGIVNGPQTIGKNGTAPTPQADGTGTRPKVAQGASRKAEKIIPTQPKGPTKAKGDAVHSTTEPNPALWSKAVGSKADKATQPPPAPMAPKGKPKAAEPAKVTDPHAWKKVTNKKKARKKAAASEPRPKVAAPPPGGNPPRGREEARVLLPPPQVAGTKKAPRRRPPRTAAVTLTCPEDGYAEAMRVAQEAIDLRDLGIEELRPKRAVTGAIVLEVPGPNGAEKASMLKVKMQEALKDLEGVRVARPVKMADLRVKDLLATTAVQMVREAVASAGGCALQDIRAGEIRFAPRGMGTLWVQCPLGAANRVVAAGRLRMGWTSSRVEILEPRRLQCYRCLEPGHVQGVCPGPVDRSTACYRCSGEGHAAKYCARDPHCALCEGMGLASGHRIGGRACRAPKKGPKPRKAPTTVASSERMEVEIAPPAVRGGPGASPAPVPVRRREKDRKPQPARCGGSPLAKGTPALARREHRKDGRPAVRGESPQGGAPVPERPAAQAITDEMMEVEVFPETQPPKEQRLPRERRGQEEPPDGQSPSPPRG